MQVKQKLFPYPVLNHQKSLSNFNDLNFILDFEPEITDAAYVMKNTRFTTDSQLINQLYDKNKIEINCVVECSKTVYRKAFKLSREGRNIVLPKVDFVEKVVISMFATTTEAIKLSSSEFEDDYQGLEFELDKYDILAANDGFNIRFKHSEAEGNLAQSIFTIIVNHDLEQGGYIVETNTSKKICITMSEADYNNYKVIYTVPTYKEVFFNMLLVPALIQGLTDCKVYLNEDSSRDLEDVGNQYLWFRTIISSYKKLKGEELTIDDFKNTSSVKLSQELLGQPLGTALSSLVTELKGKNGGDTLDD